MVISIQEIIKKNGKIRFIQNTSLNESIQTFTNQYGAIRRNKVYSKFIINSINLNEVTDLYREWRDDAEFFILRGLRMNIQQDLYNNQLPQLEQVYAFVKASKRGNDVYKELTKRKLKKLIELTEKQYFREHQTDKRTKMLFITLTYDPKRADIKQSLFLCCIIIKSYSLKMMLT